MYSCETVMHQQSKTYKDALIEIKNIFQMVSTIKQQIEGKIGATVIKQKTLHDFWKS